MNNERLYIYGLYLFSITRRQRRILLDLVILKVRKWIPVGDSSSSSAELEVGYCLVHTCQNDFFNILC